MIDMISFSPELDADSRISEHTAYMELWSAVMRMAIWDVENDRKRRRKGTRSAMNHDAHTALVWIMDDSPRRFGFIWTCNLFSLDPKRVRDHVLTDAEKTAYTHLGVYP